MTIKVETLLLGKTVPLGRHAVPSGIFKHPVGAATLTCTGLIGDEQGDKKHHGGPEKAIHHYPYEHYELWRNEIPEIAGKFAKAGAFGENISTVGLTEANICLGDVFKVGTARLQVSQGRQPCWRLNERFGFPAMAARVQASGRTGWYYRVLEQGRLTEGDEMELIDRPAEGWTVEQILHVLYADTLNTQSLAELAEMKVLALSWRNLARRRLQRQKVEDWTLRLETPISPG